VSAAKRKGTSWETAIVTFLRPFFPWADRVPLSGARDRGDVTVGPGSPVIEAKNQNRLSWAEWLDEAEAEARNAGAPFGVVWAKRRGKASPGDGYVLMSGHTYVKLMHDAGYAPPADGAA
jgi:hypothetical protein